MDGDEKELSKTLQNNTDTNSVINCHNISIILNNNGVYIVIKKNDIDTGCVDQRNRHTSGQFKTPF